MCLLWRVALQKHNVGKDPEVYFSSLLASRLGLTMPSERGHRNCAGLGVQTPSLVSAHSKVIQILYESTSSLSGKIILVLGRSTYEHTIK